MTPGNILALDIGTSSTKVVLFGSSGRAEAEAEAKYPTSCPVPGQQEQDPLDWWRSAVAAVRRLGALPDVAAVAFSGTMQNVIIADDDGEPLRPAILYSDSRAASQFNRLAPALIADGMPSIIGNQPNEFMAAFKVRWLLENEHDAFELTRFIHFGAKDYVVHRLTGRHVTDPVTATTVGLMNLRSRSWDAGLVQHFRIAQEKLPVIEPSHSVVGCMGEEAARELGLPAGVPVVNGLGDAGASTVAAGITEAGQAYIYLGTTAWVARISELADATLPGHAFVLAHTQPEKVIEIAPLLSGGDCVEWLIETLGLGLETVSPPAKSVDTCPPELLFLPYLKGERSPFVDTQVRGGFVMLDRSHGPAEMFYAVMEGVAFSLRANLDLLGVKADTIRLLGGGGVSEVWPQLIADATGKIVEVAGEPSTAPAFGAYCEAARTFDRLHGGLHFGRRVAPRPERLERNQKRLRLFHDATAFARALGHQ